MSSHLENMLRNRMYRSAELLVRFIESFPTLLSSAAKKKYFRSVSKPHFFLFHFLVGIFPGFARRSVPFCLGSVRGGTRRKWGNPARNRKSLKRDKTGYFFEKKKLARFVAIQKKERYRHSPPELKGFFLRHFFLFGGTKKEIIICLPPPSSRFAFLGINLQFLDIAGKSDILSLSDFFVAQGIL